MSDFLAFVQKHCTISTGKISGNQIIKFLPKLIEFITFWSANDNNYVEVVVFLNIIMESMLVYDAAT